jgi:RNA polymerase-binding protein DksA
MAKELEDQEVVDALGNDTRADLRAISAALQRIDAGDYGLCLECGDPIAVDRLRATPVAEHCIDCANELERLHA